MSFIFGSTRRHSFLYTLFVSVVIGFSLLLSACGSSTSTGRARQRRKHPLLLLLI